VVPCMVSETGTITVARRQHQQEDITVLTLRRHFSDRIRGQDSKLLQAIMDDRDINEVAW